MLKQFDCEGCGVIDYVLINGYGFGDRLLEDVYFEVRIKDEKFVVALAPGQDEYCHQLNMVYWLEKAQAYAEQHDFGECPHCRSDVCLEEYEEPQPQNPSAVHVFSFGQIIDNHND